MYYSRTISNEFSEMLQTGGSLGWLPEFVKDHEELDMQTCRSSSKEWVSVYYGQTRLIIIRKLKNSMIFIDTDEVFHALSQGLYGRRRPTDNFKTEIEDFLSDASPVINKNNKEDFIQTSFSRRYGLFAEPDDEFVIIDREPAVRKSTVRAPDFLGLDRDGNILLVEFIDAADCQDISSCFVQLGSCHEFFSILPRPQLEFLVSDILAQKQKISLINLDWRRPQAFREIVPVMVFSQTADCNKVMIDEILQLVRSKKNDLFLEGLRTYEYNQDVGLRIIPF